MSISPQDNNFLSSIKSFAIDSLPQSGHDVVALIVHGVFAELGLVLCNGQENLQLSRNWNRKEVYTFEYKAETLGTRKTTIKCLPVDNLLLVSCYTSGESKLSSLTIQIDKEVKSSSSFDLSQNLFVNFKSLYESVHQFALSYVTTVTDAEATMVELKPVPQQEPNIIDARCKGESSSSTSLPFRHPPQVPSLIPDFPESPSVFPAPPFRIGTRDLDPLAGSHPASGAGGMLFGPDHPGWAESGQFSQDPAYYLPPDAIPPGARFDPIFPTRPLMPHSRPARPVRPFPKGPPTGEPDFDDFPPPGSKDMFM